MTDIRPALSMFAGFSDIAKRKLELLASQGAKTISIEIQMPDGGKGAVDKFGRVTWDEKYPWQKEPLNDWAIVGVNHYHVDGQRRIFVSMEKDGRCIKSDGPDNWVIWNNLSLLAENEKQFK